MLLKKDIYKLAEVLEKEAQKRMLSEKDPADVYRELVLLRFFQDKRLFVDKFSQGLAFFESL